MVAFLFSIIMFEGNYDSLLSYWMVAVVFIMLFEGNFDQVLGLFTMMSQPIGLLDFFG